MKTRKNLYTKKLLLVQFLWIYPNSLTSLPVTYVVPHLCHSHGPWNDAVIFTFSYLKHRKQGAQINNITSFFKIFLSGVPTGSLLEPLPSIYLYFYIISIISLFLYSKLWFVGNFVFRSWAENGESDFFWRGLEPLLPTM